MKALAAKNQGCACCGNKPAECECTARVCVHCQQCTTCCVCRELFGLKRRITRQADRRRHITSEPTQDQIRQRMLEIRAGHGPQKETPPLPEIPIYKTPDFTKPLE